MSIDINPSILSSDFSDLRGELEKISTADMAHIDVMDNHFVPNLTFGPPVVERIQANRYPVWECSESSGRGEGFCRCPDFPSAGIKPDLPLLAGVCTGRVHV